MVFKDLTLEYHFHHQYSVLIPNHTVGIFIQAHFFPIQIVSYHPFFYFLLTYLTNLEVLELQHEEDLVSALKDLLS